MPFDQQAIDNLIAQPSEALSVELKRWLSPNEPAGIAKIVRTVLALRNFNGGFMVIGFDDRTLLPDTTNVPPNVRASFHVDIIQPLILQFVSEPFEIEVAFSTRDNQEYPVIVVPSGVRTPVATRKDLPNPADPGKNLINQNSAYFRTLNSNRKPSTSVAQHNDWNSIVSICFNNREADIGQFFRRHLAGLNIGSISSLLETLALSDERSPTLEQRTRAFLDTGEEYFQAAISSRNLNTHDRQFVSFGSWSAALVIDEVPPIGPGRDFLTTVLRSNPRYTGWPSWTDTRGAWGPESYPQFVDLGWNSLVVHTTGSFKDIQFMRLKSPVTVPHF